MNVFKKDLDKYQRAVYDLITERLTYFQEKYEPFNRENGARFTNKIIDLMMKVSLYPKLLQLYRESEFNDKMLSEVINEMLNDYANKLQVNYASSPREHPPMWDLSNTLSPSKTREINDKIDRFVDNLRIRIGVKSTNFMDRYQFNPEMCGLFIEANELFEVYFIRHFIYRAARAEGIGREGMMKYIKENFFWKGKAAEIMAVVKDMEIRSAS